MPTQHRPSRSGPGASAGNEASALPGHPHPGVVARRGLFQATVRPGTRPGQTALPRVGGDLTAKYIGLECVGDYLEPVVTPTVPYPQTNTAFDLADDVPPRKYHHPWKFRAPIGAGFTNPICVTAIHVANPLPQGLWTGRGHGRCSGP